MNHGNDALMNGQVHELPAILWMVLEALGPALVCTLVLVLPVIFVLVRQLVRMWWVAPGLLSRSVAAKRAGHLDAAVARRMLAAYLSQGTWLLDSIGNTAPAIVPVATMARLGPLLLAMGSDDARGARLGLTGLAHAFYPGVVALLITVLVVLASGYLFSRIEERLADLDYLLEKS